MRAELNRRGHRTARWTVPQCQQAAAPREMQNLERDWSEVRKDADVLAGRQAVAAM